MNPRPRGMCRAAIAASVLLSMGALFVTGFTEAFLAPDKPKLVGDEKDEMELAEASAKFRDGSLARSVETNFRLRGRVRRLVAPYWSAVLMKLRDVPNRKVILGEDGMLFYRQRVELDYDHQDEGPSVLAGLFGAVGRNLAAWGTELIVVPLPRKAVACNAWLPSGVPYHPDFDGQVIDTLRGRGVREVDLLPAWKKGGTTVTAAPLYLRHDSHWSRVGAQSFADEIARQVPELPRASAVIETLDGPPNRTGGSLQYVGVRRHHPAYEWTSPKNDASLWLLPGGREGRINAGEERAEILLAGSSFCAGFFAQAVLASTLQSPVASSSLRGRLPLVALRKGLLASPAEDIPRFAIVEFPMHQAASIQKRSDAPARSCFMILHHLQAQKRATVVPTESFPARRDRPKGPGRPVVVYPAGTLLSSGDGAMSLRIAVKSETITRWRVVSDGMIMKIQIPPGEHVRMMPFVEGQSSTGAFQLQAQNAESMATEVTLDVTTDADLAAAVALPGHATEDGTWTYSVPTTTASHDSLVLRWNEAPKALNVRASGTDAEGRAFARSWHFPRVAGARIAIFSLGALGEATLENVTVEGGNGTMTAELAPLKRSR